MADIVIIDESQRHERTLRPGERVPIHRLDAEKEPRPRSNLMDEFISPATARPFLSKSPYISQEHAEIGCTDEGKFWVKDLDSANGTWVRLPPYQQYDLPANFEVLLAKNLLIQRRAQLWESFPDMKRFKSVEDFVAHVRAILKEQVTDLRIVPIDSADSNTVNQLVGRLPLLDQRAYLVVTWKSTTFDMTVERWLQTCVLLFNSSQHAEGNGARDEVAWRFVAASTDRQLVLQRAKRVAPTACTVLLYGPSGTGKEVLANDLHEHSARSRGPFVAVNCAALPNDLIEGELFGTARGAFTGAIDRAGLFEQANGGTIFLDEIGELPLHLQPKLLRVLETRKVRRIGDRDSEERPINVRIITATNRNLEKMVEEGKFRADLRFRLDAVQLALPELRSEDVMALVPPICKRFVEEGFPQLSEDEQLALCRLAARAVWPGNARELRSALQRYLTFRDPKASIEENWQFALQSSGSMSLPIPVPVQAAPEETAAAEEMPPGLGQVKDLLDTLVFLCVAKKVLLPNRWGAITELGHRFGMTGAGVSARLKRLKVATDPELDVAQLEAQIESTRAALKPYQAFLRGLLTIQS